MHKIFIALIAASALFSADEFTPPGSLPPKRPRFVVEEEKTSRWLVSGDFLYWVPEMEGLTFAYRMVPAYAVKSRPSQENPKEMEQYVAETARYKTRTLKGNWEPGVRLSMGYLFDEKGWDVLTKWSYFRNEPSRQINQKDNKRNVAPAFLSANGFMANTVNSAKAKWNLFQNSAEIEVGRNFPVGDVFLARPFAGFKGLSIKNRTSFLYTLNVAEISAVSELVTKSSFIGAGPLLGGNLAYEFGKGFGMFFLGSGSVLYGKFKASFDGVDKRRHAPRTVTAMQVQMGGQWKRTFMKKYHFGLQTAWEQNFYSNVNQALNHFVQNIKEKTPHEEGDMVLKGLTASCHLDF